MSDDFYIQNVSVEVLKKLLEDPITKSIAEEEVNRRFNLIKRRNIEKLKRSIGISKYS